MAVEPKTTWADLEPNAAGKGSEHSKEALRELIETRRYNDLVRKREFDFLRQIRLQGGAPNASGQEPPSRLQTQWLIGPASEVLATPGSEGADTSRPWWRKRAQRPGMDTVQVAQYVPDAAVASALPQFQKTEILPVSDSESAVMVLSTDQRIHAAARAFASGDDMGAELHLLLVVGQPGGEEDAQAWLTLLELYHVTGQAEVYQSRATEFVSRFGRAAPPWHNGLSENSASAAQQPVWSSPVQPQLTDLIPLQMLAQPGAPLSLDWSRLAAMDDKTVRALTGLCKLWSSQTLQLEVRGATRLLAYLAGKTPCGVPHTERLWWEARLAVLHMLGRDQEFGAVAKDFAATYACAAPSWEPPNCRCVVRDGDTEPTRPSPAVAASQSVLQGVVADEQRPWSQLWSPPEPGPVPWEIRCDGLLRIDLSAATDFLDWLRLQHQAGLRIHLVGVSRLVAALLLSMRVGDVARLTLRQD